MISVEEVRNLINSQNPNWGNVKIPLTESVGRILAEDIFADRDFPPFDRVTMDGIALRFDSFEKGQREFEVVGMQLAGDPILELKNYDHVIEVMTGAVLPKNCNMVIRYEDLKFFEKEGKKITKISAENVFAWKNVHRQGSDQKKGSLLLEKGKCITSNLVSIIATVGLVEVTVRKLPKVAIISTGDELVDVNEIPKPYQIRKSNSTTIEAELFKRSVEYTSFHLADDRVAVTRGLESILQEYDVLLLSGGVSKGKADFLPEVLESLDVKKLFHRVAQRPGKPFWFGVSKDDKPVFAFPGNPISTIMCFRVYFLEWLDYLTEGQITVSKAILQQDVHFNPDLGYFLQVRSEKSETGEILVYPETGNGSGDLVNLGKSDAFIYLPAEKKEFKVGEKFHYFPFT